MKRKWIKLSFVILSVLAALLLLSACDVNMSTTLNIDKDFKGARIMETDYMKGDTAAEEFISSVKANAPKELEVRSEEKSGEYKLTFTLSFSSQAEYKSKVKSLIGKEPVVDMLYTESGVSPMLKLEENFSSEDLLAWIKNVKNGDQITLKHTNVNVKLDGRVYASSQSSKGRVVVNNVSEGTALFDKIEIQTGIMGVDDLARKVSFTMPKGTFDSIGQATFKSLAVSDGDIKAGIKDTGNSKTVCYEIEYSGSLAYIAKKTAEIFPGSTVEMVDDGKTSGAFSVNSIFNEKINFSGYPCEKNGTTDATLTYIQFGSTLFRDNVATGTGVTGKNDKVSISDGTENGAQKLDSFVVNCNKSQSVNVSISLAAAYELHDVAVDVDMKSSGKVKVDVHASFSGPTAASALNHAYSYYVSKYKNHKTVEVMSDSDAQGKQTVKTLVLSFNGKPEEVNAEMNYAVGTANSFVTNNKGGFNATNLYNIHHNLDITEMFKDAAYDGLLTYSFNCSGAYCKNLTAVVYDKDNVRQSPLNDMLEGSSKINSFTATFTGCGGRVDLSYQASYVNVLFIITMILIAAGVIALGTIGISATAKRSKRIRREKTDVKDKQNVERSMTLAVIKNDDGTVVPLSNQIFANRPSAVVDSKRDDGLDEDDDDPENVWLFSTTLKMLAVIAAVLVFFPFVTVSCSNLAGTKNLSAFTIMMGNIEGVEAYGAAWLLLIVPIIIFLLLLLWNKLPKLINAIVVGCLSAVNLFMLIRLPDAIKEHIARSSTYQDKITSFSMNWAYSYSVIIYILLVLGSVMLLLSEVSEKVKKKFR